MNSWVTRFFSRPGNTGRKAVNSPSTRPKQKYSLPKGRQANAAQFPYRGVRIYNRSQSCCKAGKRIAAVAEQRLPMEIDSAFLQRGLEKTADMTIAQQLTVDRFRKQDHPAADIGAPMRLARACDQFCGMAAVVAIHGKPTDNAQRHLCRAGTHGAVGMIHLPLAVGPHGFHIFGIGYRADEFRIRKAGDIAEVRGAGLELGQPGRDRFACDLFAVGLFIVGEIDDIQM